MDEAVIKALVNEQAEDAGLWFVAETCAEAYLQAALRRLHAVIEDDKIVLAALSATKSE